MQNEWFNMIIRDVTCIYILVNNNEYQLYGWNKQATKLNKNLWFVTITPFISIIIDFLSKFNFFKDIIMIKVN